MKKVFLIFVIAVLMFLLAFLLAGCETRKFDTARFSSRKWTEVAAFEQVEPGEPIQFLRPIRGTFKVVWVDLSYQNALVTTEDQSRAYLLTYLPRLPEWRKRNLSSLAHERGYR